MMHVFLQTTAQIARPVYANTKSKNANIGNLVQLSEDISLLTFNFDHGFAQKESFGMQVY